DAEVLGRHVILGAFERHETCLAAARIGGRLLAPARGGKPPSSGPACGSFFPRAAFVAGRSPGRPRRPHANWRKTAKIILASRLLRSCRVQLASGCACA